MSVETEERHMEFSLDRIDTRSYIGRGKDRCAYHLDGSPCSFPRAGTSSVAERTAPCLPFGVAHEPWRAALRGRRLDVTGSRRLSAPSRRLERDRQASRRGAGAPRFAQRPPLLDGLEGADSFAVWPFATVDGSRVGESSWTPNDDLAGNSQFCKNHSKSIL